MSPNNTGLRPRAEAPGVPSAATQLNAHEVDGGTMHSLSSQVVHVGAANALRELSNAPLAT